MKDAHALNLILTKIMNLNQARPDDIKYCPFIFSEIHEPSASIRNGPAPVRGPDACGHVQGIKIPSQYNILIPEFAQDKIQIRLSNHNLNQKLEYPFSIPGSYKRIN